MYVYCIYMLTYKSSTSNCTVIRVTSWQLHSLHLRSSKILFWLDGNLWGAPFVFHGVVSNIVVFSKKTPFWSSATGHSTGGLVGYDKGILCWVYLTELFLNVMTPKELKASHWMGLITGGTSPVSMTGALLLVAIYGYAIQEEVNQPAADYSVWGQVTVSVAEKELL